MKISHLVGGVLAQALLCLGAPTNDSSTLSTRAYGGCIFEAQDDTVNGTVCGQRGTLGNPSLAARGNSTVLVEGCASQCAHYPGCISFGFTGKWYTCTLYSKPISEQRFKPDSSSAEMLYHRSCFKRVCPCAYRGMQFAVYNNYQGSNRDGLYTVFDPIFIKTQVPRYESITHILGGLWTVNLSSDAENITAYNTSYKFARDTFVLNHRGYLHPWISGIYEISISNPDDIVFVWIGRNAYAGWTRENVNLSGNKGRPGVTLIQIELSAGHYYPFRVLYANAYGSANFFVSVTDPDGHVLLDESGEMPGFVVTHGCRGEPAPAFAPFGFEQ